MARKSFARISPSGYRLNLSWDGDEVASEVCGIAFAGGSYGRGFQVSPAGSHDFAEKFLFDAQLVSRLRHRKQEIRISTARDGSSTIASLIGSHHELMTVFSGPAPETAMIGELFAALDVKDNANGMRVEPAAATGLTLSGEHVFVQHNDATSIDAPTPPHARALIPNKAGRKTKHGEVWRTLLPGKSGAKVHDYSYLVGTPTGVAEVVFGDESQISEDAALALLDGLDVSWS